MKKIALMALTAALCATGFAQEKTTEQKLTDHVYYLASDELRGRAAGSEDALKAMQYIQAEYEAIGLKPFLECGWVMNFKRGGNTYRDLVGVIEGSDPELKNEYIVLGAHYDHLGVKNDKVYNGADDNASGSAMLIEVARQLYAAKDQLKRSVIIAAFDGEELGLFGSQALADTLDTKLGIIGNIKLMMSLDMVGWYAKSGKLILEGTSTIKDGKRLAQAEAVKYGITIKPKKFETSALTATDTEGFAKKQVPTLAVSTGMKSPYHKPGDDADLIDYAGMSSISNYIADLTTTAAADPEFDGSGKVASKHRGKIPAFEFGFEVSTGSGAIDFRKSSITTKSGVSYNAGVCAQLNSGSGLYGLKASALYELVSSMYPSSSDLLNEKSAYYQAAITVPVMLMIQARDTGGGAFAGFGAYFSQVLGTSCDETLPGTVPDIQYGLAGTFGVRLGRLSVSYTGRGSLCNLFEQQGSPKARLNTSYFTVGFLF